jgi:hypothetical protein
MHALGMIWGDFESLSRDFEEVRTPLPEPVHFGARLLFNHWRDRQEKGGMIVGRDVPSRELAPTLRNLVLLEPVAGARDFRVRLAGSACLRRFGRDVTGLNLSGLYEGDAFERHRRELADMIVHRQHFSMEVTLKKSRRNTLNYEVVGLPILSESGGRWAMLGIFYHDWVG